MTLFKHVKVTYIYNMRVSRLKLIELQQQIQRRDEYISKLERELDNAKSRIEQLLNQRQNSTDHSQKRERC